MLRRGILSCLAFNVCVHDDGERTQRAGRHPCHKEPEFEFTAWASIAVTIRGSFRKMSVEKSLKSNIHDANTEQIDCICQIINEKRVDILLKFYQQMHNHVRASEVFETRISFGVIAIYLLTTVFLFRGDVSVHATAMATGLLAGFNVALFLFAWALLKRNQERLLWQCKNIVRAERFMGLYADDVFGRGKILEDEDANWGASLARKFTLYHLAGMAISAVVPIAILHTRPLM